MLSKLTAIPIICALWLVTAIFRLLPLSLCWKIGNAVGSIGHALMPKRRAIIRQNLETVAKSTGNLQVTDLLVKKIFRRSITNLVCAIKTYTMTPAQVARVVTVKVHPTLTSSIRQDKGAILCLAHMGNWEILSKITPLIHPEFTPFGAVYRPLDNKTADRYVAEQRHKYGCQMFPKGTPMGTLSTFLKNGGVLGILADQRAGGSKNNRPFFNRPSSRSKLPAILHRRTGAPLFSLAVHTDEPATWTITTNPIDSPQNPTTDQIVDAITASYETIFALHLNDVFWLHTYWREKRRKKKKSAQ